MPLYMDIHTVDADDFSAEDVVKAHMEDLAIQDRFGVKQIKYWVNENAKTIFCLMTGPNKEACHKFMNNLMVVLHVILLRLKTMNTSCLWDKELK